MIFFIKEYNSMCLPKQLWLAYGYDLLYVLCFNDFLSTSMIFCHGIKIIGQSTLFFWNFQRLSNGFFDLIGCFGQNIPSTSTKDDFKTSYMWLVIFMRWLP